MSPSTAYVLAILAGIADAIAILVWLKIEPKHIFKWEWRMREINVTAGKLAMIVALAFISICLSTYGFYQTRVTETASAMPRIVGWGVGNKHCNVMVDTSLIASLADDYQIVLACGVADPTVDALEDTRIMLSGKFNISAGTQAISAPSNPDFDKYMDSLGNMTVGMWQRVFLVPQGAELSNIHKLSDVPRIHGKLYK
jgi:hypothetical protein